MISNSAPMLSKQRSSAALARPLQHLIAIALLFDQAGLGQAQHCALQFKEIAATQQCLAAIKLR